jgi:hypothetical protein
MTNSPTDTLVEFDDLEDVANCIFEHTGSEAVVEHTMAEGLMPLLARELRLDLRFKSDADRAYHVGKLVARRIMATRKSH